jgi:hypothetical protein
MDIRSHLSTLRAKPSAYHTIGLGMHAWALVHPDHRDEVLLLEQPRLVHTRDGVLPASTRKAHERSVQFSKKYDRFIASGLESGTESVYTHSSLLGSIAPQPFGAPLLLQLNEKESFSVHSARLVRRIQGTPLHYLHFVDPQAPLHNPHKVDSLAKDIANWLFTVHHKISPEVMTRYRVVKQFADVGASITKRYEHNDKYQLFVIKNVRDAETLPLHLAGVSVHPDMQSRLKRNLDHSGIAVDLLIDTARVLGQRLGHVFARDRVGLAHTDVHPENIIVNSSHTNVSGVCDWSNGTIAPQAMDFAGLGLARGLLPRVVAHYTRAEKTQDVQQPVNKEAAFGFAAMRQLFFVIKNLKNSENDPIVPVAWQQVGEAVQELRKIEPRHYNQLAQRFEQLDYVQPSIPLVYKKVSSQPVFSVKSQ